MDKIKWLKTKMIFHRIIGWSLTIIAIIIGLTIMIVSIKSPEDFWISLFITLIIVAFPLYPAWKYGFKKDMDIQSEIIHYEALNKLADK